MTQIRYSDSWSSVDELWEAYGRDRPETSGLGWEPLARILMMMPITHTDLWLSQTLAKLEKPFKFEVLNERNTAFLAQLKGELKRKNLWQE